MQKGNQNNNKHHTLHYHIQVNNKRGHLPTYFAICGKLMDNVLQLLGMLVLLLLILCKLL